MTSTGLSDPDARSGAVQLATGTLAVFLCVKLGAHVLTNIITPYEFHRDELLYLAMGTHLRILHMDFPPMIALLGNVARVFGDTSLFAVRMVPALAGTIVLLLTVLITRELGGARSAQTLAAVTVLCNPLFLRSANLFQPVALDQLTWLLGFYAVLRLRNTNDIRWWLLLGTAGGLGLLTKFSILFFGLAVLVGVLLTDQRRAFKQPWPWVTMLMALLIGLPSIVGQLNLDFPLVGQMSSLREVQLERTTFGDFVMGQVLFGPGFFLALIGLIALFVHSPLRHYRIVGWISLTAFVVIAALKGKSYYIGPVHPVLYAAGAVALEHITRTRLQRVARWAIAASVVAYGLFSLPFGLPFLPPEPMARYAAATGITAAVTTNRGEVLRLPQDYGDMLGWREQAEAVATVYHALPAVDQERTVLYGANYGEAGALDLYGPKLGLPPVVSLAGSFYFFGPGHLPGEVLLFVGVPREAIEDMCSSLELAMRVTHEWTVEENDVPVFVCRAPSVAIQEVWEENRGGHQG